MERVPPAFLPILDVPLRVMRLLLQLVREHPPREVGFFVLHQYLRGKFSGVYRYDANHGVIRVLVEFVLRAWDRVLVLEADSVLLPVLPALFKLGTGLYRLAIPNLRQLFHFLGRPFDVILTRNECLGFQHSLWPIIRCKQHFPQICR